MAWTYMTLFKTPKAPTLKPLYIDARWILSVVNYSLDHHRLFTCIHTRHFGVCLAQGLGWSGTQTASATAPLMLANCKTKDVKWLCYWQRQLRMFAVGLHSRERGINLRQFFFFIVFIFTWKSFRLSKLVFVSFTGPVCVATGEKVYYSVGKYSRLPVSGPTVFVNIHTHYWAMTMKSLFCWLHMMTNMNMLHMGL